MANAKETLRGWGKNEWRAKTRDLTKAIRGERHRGLRQRMKVLASVAEAFGVWLCALWFVVKQGFEAMEDEKTRAHTNSKACRQKVRWAWEDGREAWGRRWIGRSGDTMRKKFRCQEGRNEGAGKIILANTRQMTEQGKLNKLARCRACKVEFTNRRLATN
ncbi:hypothetical protein TRVL_04163 [Trypanosoma vivax]|nr:hypothetical protein TRVL_04163 [Trypanosoma vivax]